MFAWLRKKKKKKNVAKGRKEKKNLAKKKKCKRLTIGTRIMGDLTSVDYIDCIREGKFLTCPEKRATREEKKKKGQLRYDTTADAFSRQRQPRKECREQWCAPRKEQKTRFLFIGPRKDLACTVRVRGTTVRRVTGSAHI